MPVSSMAKSHLLIYPNRICQFFIPDLGQKKANNIKNQLRESFHGLFSAVNLNTMRIEK